MSVAHRKPAESCALPNKDWAAWRQARYDDLAAPDSWLGLIGLFWLAPGLNAVGNAAGSTVLLPSGPAHLGDLRWEGGRIFWQAVGAPALELATDLASQPTAVDCENLSFFIVDRDGRLAARLRDRAWAASQPFAGLDYFDFDPAWQIRAQWQALVPALRMEVPNVAGDLKTVEVSHQAVFAVEGKKVTLLPMSVGEHEVFFIFRDRSSGRESYGAGRFLKVPAATMETKAGSGGDGEILLDFNRAYSPPCAFTPFAVCPLPPPENWLPFAVPAGEKAPLK